MYFKYIFKKSFKVAKSRKCFNDQNKFRKPIIVLLKTVTLSTIKADKFNASDGIHAKDSEGVPTAGVICSVAKTNNGLK
jgi:hypothetical protein